MEFVSKYVAHEPDERGMVSYSDGEHAVWARLYERQIQMLPARACDEFIRGLDSLQLSADTIPQLPEVNDRLVRKTGWQVVPVAALISAREFFSLLAKQCFPTATFIRRMEELDYITEPDIFHELFGHCPMLCEPVYAQFLQDYARRVLCLPEKFWPLLQRLFWFTVEFGLIDTAQGLRAYGGGILSSLSETPYSIDSDEPLRVLFNPLAVFRTPYRIDRKQAIYYVIHDYAQLYQLAQLDLTALMEQACSLGEFPPFFPVDKDNPSIHIRAC
ncbi:MAG: phenylalanine 4-monooxygenase [Legionellaceae bacterium]|nr:phenylalanine 4-monooxygenase [Legionellaceae bacterium]